MHSHPDLIAAFRDGLATGTLPPGAKALPAEIDRRFAVYRNNVTHGLIEALATRFPVVKALVGDDFFRATARLFIAQHKPTNPVLMLWGEDFPGFLRGFPPAAGLPYLADVARLEYARGIAYHAADPPPLTGEALARAATGADIACVALHPSVQLLRARHAFVTIWAAHQPGAAPGEINPLQEEIALVLRNRLLDVEIWRLTRAESLFIAGLGKTGHLLGAAGAARVADPRFDPTHLILRLSAAGALISRESTDV